jgi:hypothetical protein
MLYSCVREGRGWWGVRGKLVEFQDMAGQTDPLSLSISNDDKEQMQHSMKITSERRRR